MYKFHIALVLECFYKIYSHLTVQYHDRILISNSTNILVHLSRSIVVFNFEFSCTVLFVILIESNFMPRAYQINVASIAIHHHASIAIHHHVA